jgi:hypothetical protein
VQFAILIFVGRFVQSVVVINGAQSFRVTKEGFMSFASKLIAASLIALPTMAFSQGTTESAPQAQAVPSEVSQQGLTNSDIIKMQSVGLSESIILSSVNTQPAAYDTSTDGLMALKKAGVSDAVVAATIYRNATMNASLRNTRSASLPAATGSPAGVDEVGVYYQDRNNTWQPMLSEVVNTKSGGVLKHIATDGIVKEDMNGHVKGAESETRLTADTNILIFMQDNYTASDYVLVRLHRNSNNREFRAVTGGVFHSSGGATKDTVEFGSQKVAPHMYRLIFSNPPSPGEYGIIPPGAIATTTLAARGKIFSFSIIE